MEKETKGTKHLKTKSGKCGSCPDVPRKLLPFISDIIAAISIALLAILEFLYFKGCCPVLNSFEVFIVSTTLLPCIVTILSISLSVSNEKIYGAKLSEIKELRSSFYFGFYHAILISCVAFACNILLKQLGLGISLFFLEVIAFIYCLIFILQDVPVLARSGRKIEKLLRNYYKKIASEEHFNLDNKHEVFTRMVANMLLTSGVKNTFCALNSTTIDENKLIYDLLEIQNDYLHDIKCNVSGRQFAGAENYYENSVIRIVNTAYDNIDILAFSTCIPFYEGKLTHEQRQMVASSILNLHKICKSLELQENEHRRIVAMLSRSWPCQKNYANQNAGFVIVLLIAFSTINDGEAWFLRLLRDSIDGLDYLFSCENPLGFYISMIIHFFANEHFLIDKGEEIKAFLDEPAKGVNSDGSSWKIMMKRKMDDVRTEQAFDWLPWFWSCYEATGEATRWYHGNKKRTSFDANDFFTIKNVVHDWLIMLCNSCGKNFTKTEFNSFVDSLNDVQRRAIAEELSNNWTERDLVKSNNKIPFLTFFGLVSRNESIANLVGSYLKEAMIEYPQRYYSDKLNESLKNKQNLEQMSSDVRKGMQDIIINNPFFDASIGIDGAEERSIRFKFSIDHQGKWLKRILDNFSERIKRVLENEVLQKVPAITIPKGELEEQTKMRVLNFDPCYITKDNWLFNTLEPEFRRILRKGRKILKIDDIGDISNICVKEKGIRLNAILEEGHAAVRELRDDEMVDIFANDCANLEDGNFRYLGLAGQQTENIALPKGELEQYIRATVFYVDLKYRCKVELAPEKIMRMKWER